MFDALTDQQRSKLSSILRQNKPPKLRLTGIFAPGREKPPRFIAPDDGTHAFLEGFAKRFIENVKEDLADPEYRAEALEWIEKDTGKISLSMIAAMYGAEPFVLQDRLRKVAGRI